MEKAEAVPIRREAQINDRPIILGERRETWEADSPIGGRMARSVALTRKEETGGHGHIGWQLSSSVALIDDPPSSRMLYRSRPGKRRCGCPSWQPLVVLISWVVVVRRARATYLGHGIPEPT
jgi:hypothetical protein